MLPGSRLRLMAAAALLSLVTGVSVAVGQTNRPWVDPPAAAPAQPASPPREAAPVRSPPSGQAAPRAATAAPPNAVAKAQPRRKSLAERKSRKATAASAPKARRDHAARAATRRVKSAASRRDKLAASPRDATTAGRRLTRQQRQTIQRALAAGMEVIHQRTLEFEDGRRVNVYTPLSAVPDRL